MVKKYLKILGVPLATALLDTLGILVGPLLHFTREKT